MPASVTTWGRWIRRFIQVAVFAGCVVFLVGFFRDNQDELLRALEIDPMHLMIVAGALAFYYFVYSYRFQRVVEVCSGRELRLLAWFRLMVVGRFLNGLLPQIGNVYRTVKLKQDFGVRHTAYVSALASYMWLDMLVNLSLALVIVWTTASQVVFWGYRAEVILIVLLSVGAAGPVMVHRFLVGRELNGTFAGPVEARMRAVFDGVMAMRRPRDLSVYVVLGLVLFGIMVGVFYLLFLGMGVELDLVRLALFYALYRLTVYVTITPGNLGVREVAYGIIGEQLGVGVADAVLVAIILRALGYLVLAFLGVLAGGVGLTPWSVRIAGGETPVSTADQGGE